MLMLRAPECNHNKLIKKTKKNLFLSPLILSISQIQFYVQISSFTAFNLSRCADVFITFSSSSTSFSRPSLAGEKHVCCVGWIAPEFLSCTASISHPGWWMKRTSGSGGWKRPHIGSQRGLKNKEQCLWDEKLKESSFSPNRASKINAFQSSLCITQRY